MHKLFRYDFIYLIPLLLSAIFSLRSFGLKWPKPYRIFSIYLILTLCTEIFAIAWKWYLYKTVYWNYSKSNLWIYNSFHLPRILLFILFYYKMIDSIIIKRNILITGAVLLLFGIIDYLFIQPLHSMNNYTLIFTNIFCVILALLFFRQVLQEKKIIKLSGHPMTWISLGTLLYYAGSLPHFIFFNYLFENYKELALSLLNIHQALNIIMYTSYLIAFLCKPPSAK